MAIKGRAYLKTNWAFQERPVPSTKLNDWDDRIEAALELVHLLLNMTWGGANGVVPGATDHDLLVSALPIPGLAAEIAPGYAYISRNAYRLTDPALTPEIQPPTLYPRIDLVQARLRTWDVSVKTGHEAASPIPPQPDTDCMALARLHLRPGMTCIKNADDGLNGHIVDARAFLS